jgi:hypothetical protein
LIMGISRYKKNLLLLFLVVAMVVLVLGCNRETVPVLETMEGEDRVNEMHISHGTKDHGIIQDKAIIDRVVEVLGKVDVYQLSIREEAKFLENGEKLNGQEDFYSFTLIEKQAGDDAVKNVVGIAMIFEDGSVYVIDPDTMDGEERPVAYLSKDADPALMATIGKITGF